MHSEILEKLYSVAGKNVLITGGSGGIGFMLAEAFVAAGARVIITGRKADLLETARAKLAAVGEISIVASDLGTPEGVANVVRCVAERELKLHVLINNAGITWGEPFETFPDKAWNSVMTVNAHAPFSLVQKLMPLLSAAATAEDPARVINIGSVYATVTDVMQAYSYAASKAALQQLTRVLARELAPRHITVNAIAPGLFHTKMTGFALREEASRKALISHIPLARTGTPEDIAGVAIMLSSRAGAYITGGIIPLDGGLLINH